MDERVSVIIVDDEMISRGYMELFIKPSRKYEVTASLPFASDALAWCRNRERDLPDLILMDVMMANEIDGLTAAGNIKKEFPSVRIIITTSMADADWLDKARAAGIEGFWFKNYPQMSLLDAMDKVMFGETVYCLSGRSPGSGAWKSSGLPPWHRRQRSRTKTSKNRIGNS